MHDFLHRLTSLPWDQAPQWILFVMAMLFIAGMIRLHNRIYSAFCAIALGVTLNIFFAWIGAKFVGFNAIVEAFKQWGLNSAPANAMAWSLSTLILIVPWLVVVFCRFTRHQTAAKIFVGVLWVAVLYKSFK